MEALWITLGVLVLLLLIFIGIYNGLVSVRNHCNEAWSNVDTELKRRHDLIPNLVSTVKGYAAHEKDLLEKVTSLREKAQAPHDSVAAHAADESMLTKVLGRLMARLEAYPDLKASANFLELQHEITNTEDRIQAALRFFNGNVRENNNKVQQFPSNLIASMFSFAARDYFEIEHPAERQTPEVKI